MTDVFAPMTPQEFRFVLKKLNLSQRALVTFLGVTDVTVRRWKRLDGAGGPPPAVAKLLRYMVALGLTPDAVDGPIRRAYHYRARTT